MPVRFLQPGGTLLLDDGECIRSLAVTADDIAAVPSSFAYPFGEWCNPDTISSATSLNVDRIEVLRRWRLALCFEALGAMQAALDMTVEYVKVRHLFGRPLGAFQAIHHRLAECAVLVSNARLLARAAIGGKSAQRACGYAQEAAARVAYECHQFHGAIGLTLEHPLHFLTYRLRILQGELGGVSAQYGQGITLEPA
jgi:hypothetical protein